MQTQEIKTNKAIEENTINNFIKNEYVKNNNKITIVNEYSDFNPTMNSVESSRMNHYKVTLKRKFKLNGNHLDTRYGYKQMTLFFSQGYGISGEPTLDSVLDCLKSDYYCAIDGFEEFCANCGYSDDSIKSLKTYKNIQRQSKKLKTFLGDSFNQLLNCDS
tara:strand:- start:11 stop:493 length:483 start_codon:yes stop_codon:yes gene_type:complete